MSEIRCDIKFGHEGLQRGHFYIPCPRNDSAWGVISIPIIYFKSGEAGPRLLFTGGAHGDEFEGPIALRNLAEMIESKDVDYKGELIIIPVMNIPAMKSSQRLSPLDGRDLNRSFSKHLEGVTPSIAQYIMDFLIPKVDVVFDFHSGGNSLDFVPSILMHNLSDASMREKTKEALKAFGAPYAIILEEIDATGMLDTYVEGLGKLFLTTELRGGGKVNLDGMQVAHNGLIRLLHFFGFIPELEAFKSHLQNYDTTFFEVPSEKCFCRPATTGVFEPLFKLGDSVKKGELVGLVHSIESCETVVEKVFSQVDGYILADRPKAWCAPGDSLFMIGQKI